MQSPALSPLFLFLGLVILLIGCLFSLPSIPLTIQHHQFASQVSYWGIPAFTLIFSSLCLVSVGVFGLIKHTRYTLNTDLITGLITFLIALILSGIGSAIYHWNPQDQTILFKQIPISILCMGLSFSLLVSQSKLASWGWFYGLMMAYAILSPIYGIYAHQVQIYYATQFFPIALMILLIARIWSSSYTTSLIYGVIFLVLGKGAEISDHEIYQWTTQWVDGQMCANLLYALGYFKAFQFFSQMRPRELLVEDMSGV